MEERRNFSSSGVSGGGSVVRSIRSASVKNFLSVLAASSSCFVADAANDDARSVGKLSGLCNPKLKSVPSRLKQKQNKAEIRIEKRAMS